MAMDDPAAALAQLKTSLDGLEGALAPILSQPWNETLEGTTSVERAKMDVLLAYSINNLVWMYLRTRGIKPEEHAVSGELERLQAYYTKVRDVENPPRRTTSVDKDAAARVIKHAIPRSQRVDTDASASTSAAALARDQAIAATDDMMSRRFRFVATGGEKVLPGGGAAAAAAAGGEEADGDVVMAAAVDNGDGAPRGGAGAGAQAQAEAEALLADVDGQIEAAPRAKKGGAKKKNKKRKHVE
ncbi:uncharacterized protein EHS24_007762 [Apiotrichum porosum]|uniref:Exosome complex protein n=1 Tax=Apiotrichum porosum TaxID=105984 RepID=A0A427XVD7_9TREE|nr:uncharacterized protein EHS24_007762 [Apiotrichum porosum]RSH82767.1 hypothetical protein EHS24_007762 [Apiotrichum porosum]